MTIRLINSVISNESFIKTDEIEIVERGARFFVSEPTAAQSIAFSALPETSVDAILSAMIPELVKGSDGRALTEAQARSLPTAIVKQLINYINSAGIDAEEPQKKTES